MTTSCLHERTLPLKKALMTAHGPVPLRRVQVLVVQDSAGNAGYGEAAPLPAFGSEDPLTCREKLEDILPFLDDMADRWLESDRPSGGLGPLERQLRDTPCARACVEGALLDLLAQRRGTSLAAMLAGDAPIPEELSCNALLSGNNADELAEAASQLVADGWRTLKVKVGGDTADELTKLRALREWVGDRIKIRVDANGSWDFDTAKDFINAAAELDIEYLEQPLAPDDLDGHAALRRMGAIPIAVDESVRQAADIGRVAAKQAADIIIIKPTAIGGWRHTQRAAELARNSDIEVVITTFLDGSVGRAHATHIAAALGCHHRAQGLATGGLLKHDLSEDPLPARQGSIIIPEQPGLGIGTLLPEIVAD